MNRRVLGRGLGALISEKPIGEKKDYIEQLAIDTIKPNRYQPREEFNQQKLDELIA